MALVRLPLQVQLARFLALIFLARLDDSAAQLACKAPHAPDNAGNKRLLSHRAASFPLRALAELETDGLNRNELRYSMICDVENISPTGVLVSTENQNALSLQPGNTLFLTLDPRGWFPFQISVKVQVCRIIDDFNLDNGNIFRHLGLKFIHFEEVDRKAFLRLLKDILDQLKSEFR